MSDSPSQSPTAQSPTAQSPTAQSPTARGPTAPAKAIPERLAVAMVCIRIGGETFHRGVVGAVNRS